MITTLHLLKEQEAAELLRMPEGIMQVGLLLLEKVEQIGGIK